MFVEKRLAGRRIKYYLVHSYRKGDKILKIRKYLGQDLSKGELDAPRREAEKRIMEQIERMDTKVFLFTLTTKQIDSLNRYNDEIRIHHLDQREWRKFTEEFVYNTNAIEGSTAQMPDVKDVLEKRKPPGNKEEIEADGVANAFEYVKNAKEDLSLDLIKKIHRLCFGRSKPFAGKFREVEVVIRDSRGAIAHSGVPAAGLAHALDDFVSWYKCNKKKFKPLVLAAIIHNQFEYIHPFRDGNGRVGRLLLNFILMRNGYPPISITLEDRAEYYRTLQEYSRNMKLKPTLEFLIRQYRKTLKRVSTKTEK
ncbi:MAG: Fic family protein [Candidatus Aenigmarchaeota archaeon]|nr:Fic family protein [Candidatus Aenigmarchaeota archaeon]